MSFVIFFVMLSHISFAKEIGYSCIIVLSTKSPISILKEIRTKFPVKNSSISRSSRLSVISIRFASGGLISIVLSSIEESDVAADPIIWFIASLMALKCISPSSTSIFVPSPPIIRSVMTFTSCSFNTRRLLPSSPTVYAIRINTHGRSYWLTISSQVAIATTGVEISTLWLTSENSVVAAVPMLILAISPMVSRSSAVTSSEEAPDEAAEAPPDESAPF